MHYDEYGNRSQPTIILMQCAGVVDTFSSLYDLSSEFHLVVPHFYGSGKEVNKDFSLEETKSGLLEMIKSLGEESVYIVGHSLGANITLAIVSQHEELFKKAIISSPFFYTSKMEKKLIIMYMRLAIELLKSKMMGRIFTRYLKYEGNRKDFFIDYWAKISKKTWLNYFIDDITLDMCSNFKNVGLPVQFIYGEKEPNGVKNTVLALAKEKSYSSIKCIKKGNHGHPILKPEHLRKTVLEFFQA